MIERLREFYAIPHFSKLEDSNRARMIRSMLGWEVLLFTIYAFFIPIVNQKTMVANFSTPFYAVTFFAFYIIAAASYVALHYKKLTLAGIGPGLMLYMGIGASSTFNTRFQLNNDGVDMTLLMILFGLVLGYKGLWGGFALSIASLVAGTALLVKDNPADQRSIVSLAVTLGMEFLAVAVALRLFIISQKLSRNEGVAQAADELRLANLMMAISSHITNRVSLQEVLKRAIEQIRENYPELYHCQIFLLDESGQNAVLKASTGKIGDLLVERNHSVPVGNLSVIGQAALSRQVVIARAKDENWRQRRDDALPDTQVEAAFPLNIGDSLIGVLDLQSKDGDLIESKEIPIFQSLASNIAIAIDNARLFEQTQERLVENQHLIEQTRRAAEQVERLNRQLTRTFWGEFYKEQPSQTGLEVDLLTQRVSLPSDWTTGQQQAIQSNQIVQMTATDKSNVVAMPLRVRGEVIGAMEFELDEHGRLSSDDVQMIEAVGEQLGLAAETNRLFQVTQQFAQREILVNTVASRIQASTSIEMTLAETARGLRETMGASRVSIRLGTPPTLASQESGQ